MYMEDSPQVAKSSLSVPLAIVVAGALIAGAVFLSRGNTPSNSNTGNAPATQQQNAQTAQTTVTDLAIKPISDKDHLLGNPSAPLALVVYTDLECPYCKSFHATIRRVADSYGKNASVLIVYRNFPLVQLHSRAPQEAEATECVNELGGKQMYWDYVDKIFETTTSNNTLDPGQLPKLATDLGVRTAKFNACLSSGTYTKKVQENYDEAVGAGGQGTPFSVFVSSKALSDQVTNKVKGLMTSFNLPPDTFMFSTDKHRISMSGALPYNMVQQVIDALLTN